MIQAETFYTCSCDNCGEYYGNEDHSSLVMPDETSMKSELGDDTDWHTERGDTDHPDKHYCPNCFYFNDDDLLVIREKK